MRVFDRPIVVKKQDDGSYTFSVALSDSQILVTVVEEKDLRLLAQDIENILAEEE